MREIKFRAWKKTDTPEMFENITVIDFKKKIIGIDFPISTQTLRTDVESLDNIVLMQYTGLKDKRGVEIYEGDIIREDVEKGGPPIIVSVVWEEGAFYGKERTHNPEYIAKEFLNGKVIGNIYENPELLEG